MLAGEAASQHTAILPVTEFRFLFTQIGTPSFWSYDRLEIASDITRVFLPSS